MSDFRCSAASAEDDEQLAGTALTETELLLVEAPGPWGHDAESVLSTPSGVTRDLFDRGTIRRMIGEHRSGSHDWSRALRA